MARMRPGAALLLIALVSSATAEETRNEVTVFGGQRFGGSFDVDGDTGRYDLRDDSVQGILFARHDTAAENDDAGINDPVVDIRIEQLEVGGTYAWERGRTQPYLAMTLGGARIESRARAVESDTFLSGSIGLGLRLIPAARLGLRLEARYHTVFTNDDTDLLCRTGPDANTCAVRIDGRAVGQLALFGGVSLRF